MLLIISNSDWSRPASSASALLASSPPTSGCKLPSPGIYRPPAARKALKFVSADSSQLSPAAAGEGHPFLPPPPAPPSAQNVTTPPAEGSSAFKVQPDSNNNNTSTTNEDGDLGAEAQQQAKPARAHRERRPDRAVYIPRARRSQTTPPVTSAPTTTTSSTTVPPAAAVVPCSEPPEPSVPVPLVSNCPLRASKKERSSRRSKPKDKSTTVSTVTASVITRSEDSATKPAKSEAVASFKNRSHSVEESCPAITATNKEIVKLKKQKSEEVPRENNAELVTKERRSNGSILTELNGSSKDASAMNKPSRQRASSKQQLITNGGPATEKIDRDERELRKASQEINRSNRRIIKQTFASNVLEIAEQQQDVSSGGKENGHVAPATDSREVNPEEDDWETMYDDNGDCLNPKLMEELTSAVGKVSIEVPQSDYKVYQSKQAVLNEEEFPHVLEVSNFPVEFKTQDLMMLFSQYKESGFDIKWVDDTHALAVFSSSKIAAEVLANGHTFVKLKPLAEATVESRTKARKCSSSLQPYRPRPETCAALARRLVTTALGVRLKTAPEERENERRVLREAKERKLLAAKQREEIWES
ncbi:hypothetical protein quinque_000742 [Culex quinquefasciatus]